MGKLLECCKQNILLLVQDLAAHFQLLITYRSRSIAATRNNRISIRSLHPIMSFNSTLNINHSNEFITSASGAEVEVVATEEPTLFFAPTASDAETETGSGGGLWLQNVFGGGVELSMITRNDENDEESSTSTQRIGSFLGISSYASRNKKKLLLCAAFTATLLFAAALGASRVANNRMITSAASAAKTPKSKGPKSKGPKSKAPKVTKAPKTAVPSLMPSDAPSTYPSTLPSASPSLMPSGSPSVSVSPSKEPSALPSTLPSASPSLMPSSTPSVSPSDEPSAQPSGIPSASPSLMPSSSPSFSPSGVPSASPSLQPSSTPSVTPSEEPSAQPSNLPSASPSLQPSSSPSLSPSGVPSESPSKDCSSVEGEFTGSDLKLPNRLKRGSKISRCNSPKTFPGYKECPGIGCQHLTFGPFSGSGSPDGCLEIVLDKDTCVRDDGKSSVYLSAYNQGLNQSDYSIGYLGDMNGAGRSRFEIPYTSFDPIYIVAQSGKSTKCNFSFSLSWGECDGSVESSALSVYNVTDDEPV